ncbi:MAG: ParB/RepB/Spo0J family partition protein [Gammaproteobacteria bacterium]
MSSKKRGLGRGLNELAVSELLSGFKPPASASDRAQVGIRHLPIEAIRPGRYQPRKQLKPIALQELADSIKAQGVIQPIVVRVLDKQHYELIAGERRWRASQLAGLQEIPAIIRELSDQAALAIALIENIQREDLNAIEQALALQRLVEEFTMTHQQIAEVVGKSRVTVTNLLRLLSLHSEVQTLLHDDALEMGHVRALLTLDRLQQLQIARVVVEKKLSVRDTEALVRRLQAAKSSQPTRSTQDPDILRLQTRLTDRLGSHVILHHSTKGRGRLVIHYGNLEELEGILAHLGENSSE